MKKIFTLLAFLVVTVNAAAQTQTHLNVGDPDKVDDYFLQAADVGGNRGEIDDDRLNVCGYVFTKKKGSWKWIDSNSNIQNGSANSISGWVSNEIFKGPDFFFDTYNKYSAYNSSTSTGQDKTIVFYISNCSAIDVFLYHVAATNPRYDYSGTFYIKAYPLNNDVFPTNPSLEANVTISDTDGSKSYFPSLYGLDKGKIYKIQLTIPISTFFHEISFLIKRTYETIITDGVNWGTMYLDFPVTIPNEEHPDLQVFAVSSADETNGCSVSPITGSIPKNTGVLLYEPNVSIHETITFTETVGLDPVDNNILRGTVTQNFTVGEALENMPNYKVLTLGKIDDKVGFYIYKKNQTDAVLNPYRAYLLHKYGTSTSGGEVKGIYISGFDELTGVQTVEIESTETGNWYSLQGVQLNSRPTQRGIYLNNGKKVLVK
ncbi:MAG: hypothetical protein J6T52_05225 [Bacteroidaceae bacterium]|nr:hypothetical protein [Bacteroidaceae bacterium]